MTSHPYYDDALKIHAICCDLRLPATDAKIFTYIHVKTRMNPEGVEHFYDPEATEIMALKIMLGCGFWVAEDGASDSQSAVVNGLHQTLAIHRQLEELDGKAKAEFGLEFPIRYELENRLRLYQDREFLASNLKIYREKILPRLPCFNKEDVDSTFKKHRADLASVQQKLRNIIDPL